MSSTASMCLRHPYIVLTRLSGQTSRAGSARPTTEGSLYYIDLYDDGHHLESGGPYADPAHMSSSTGFTFCRPSGDFKILVAFVDYGNIPFDHEAAVADVSQGGGLDESAL